MEEAKKYPAGTIPLPTAPVKKTFDVRIKKEERKSTCYDSISREQRAAIKDKKDIVPDVGRYNPKYNMIEV